MAEPSKRTQWCPISPVPREKPSPTGFSHPVRGQPKQIYTYRDDGVVLGYVCRFANSRGGVTQHTLTWCENQQSGERMWRWMQFPKMRPLLNLDKLAADPGASVVLVFDEPATEAAAQMMAGFIPVTWPGGIRKIDEVDWSPLRGRTVVIWPHHGSKRFKVAKRDPESGEYVPRQRQPYYLAALAIADHLRGFQATPWAIIDTGAPDEHSDGWSLVDIVNEGWSRADFNRWYDTHDGIGADFQRSEVPPLPARAPESVLPLPGAPPEDWRNKLVRDAATLRLLPELLNVRMVLQYHDDWRDVIYLDAFSHRVVKAKPPPLLGGVAGEWTDVDDSLAHEWLTGEAGILKLKTSTVAQAVQTVAKLNARNPLIDWLLGLKGKWDGKKRLDRWLANYCGAGPTADDTAVDIERMDECLRIIGRKWILGAVARALRPGVKFDYVLILEGQQGLGKSGVFSILGGPWSMDTPFSLTDKEGMETIRGVWIVEMAELDSFNKAESNAAKAFFSRTKDRFRLPYGKRSADFERASVFGATTNENEYFRDSTGNRRYWPVHCNRRGFDAEGLRRDREQLFAEAVQAYQAGEQIWPTREEETRLVEQQRRREVPDVWEGRVAHWLEDTSPAGYSKPEDGALTTRCILTKCLRVEISRIDERGHATRVGRVMRKLGYLKVEDKKIPDRFRYEKRREHEGDDD